VNCFSRRIIREFPSEPQRFVLVAVLIDGLGKGLFELVIDSLGDAEEELVRQQHEVEFLDPLQEARLLFRMNRCSFPSPGNYQVNLLADGELVAQRVITVLESRKKDE